MASPSGPSGGKAPLGADLVIPALALGFAVYFFFSIAELSWEAKANGVLIGAILVSLVAIQLVRVGVQVARGRANLGFERLWAPRDALPRRMGLVLITVAFIVAIRWAGLTLSLFVALAAALYLMGVRKPVPLVAVPLAVAASAYLLFIAALDSDLPRGPVEQLLAALLQ
jgi:putative tricarboxylic transport membrane protein